MRKGTTMKERNDLHDGPPQPDSDPLAVHDLFKENPPAPAGPVQKPNSDPDLLQDFPRNSTGFAATLIPTCLLLMALGGLIYGIVRLW